jgi:tetratricopeptide (TPR) repeat protein
VNARANSAVNAAAGRPWLDSAIECLGWAAVAAALLFQNPYGELGPDADRFLLLQILALAAVALAVFRWAGRADRRTEIRAVAASPLARWAFVMAATGALATATSVDRVRSFFGSPPRLYGLASELALVVLFVVLVSPLARAEGRERFESALLAVTGGLLAYAVLQWAGLDPLRWQVDWQGRPIAAQGNPLFLAQALVWLAPIAAGRAVARWRAGERGAAPAAAGLALAAAAVALRTGQRGPLLGLAVGTVLFAALAGLSSGERRARRAGWALAALLGLGLASGAAMALARADSFTGTASQRLLLWQSIARLFEASPPSRLLFGFGQEALPIVLPPHLPPELPERVWRPDLYHDRAHNAELDALVTGGLLRLLASLGLALAAGVAALRLAGVRRVERSIGIGSDGGERFRGIGLAAALAGHAVAAQFGVATAATATLFWVSLAMLAGSQVEPGVVREASAGAGKRAAEALRKLARREAVALGIFAGALLALVAFGAWVPAQGAGESMDGRVVLLLGLAAGGIALGLASGGSLSAEKRPGLARAAFAWFGAAALLQAWLFSISAVHEWNLALGLLGFAAAMAAMALLRSSPGPDVAADRGAKGSVEGGAGVARRALVLTVALAAVLAAVFAVVPQLVSGMALKQGRTALDAGRADMAVPLFERAFRLSPQFEDPPVALARAEQRVAESASSAPLREAAFRRAVAALAEGRRRHPGLPQLALEEAHLAARRADASPGAEERARLFEAAVASYREVLPRDPQSSAVHRGLGAALLSLGRLDEAGQELEISVRLAPRAIESRLLLGRLRLSAGEELSARAAFEAAREIDALRARRFLEALARARPEDPSAFRDLALFEIVEGRRKEATAALQRAMALTPPEEFPPLVRLTALASKIP